MYPGIRIQTRRGRDILTAIYPEEPSGKVAAYERTFSKLFPEIARRRPATAQYNCFGLPFASRRAWVMMESVAYILSDDGYRKMREGEELVPGDLAIYRNEGSLEHVGVVIEIRKIGQALLPQIMSKWGPGPEYIHSVTRTPYGLDYEYWTERP